MNIPTINLAKEVTERIDKGEFTWEEDFINLHHSPFGQGIYARSMIQFLEQAYSGLIGEQHTGWDDTLPDMLDRFCYNNGVLSNISNIRPGQGWKLHPAWKPQDSFGTRSNYTNVPMLISETPKN